MYDELTNTWNEFSSITQTVIYYTVIYMVKKLEFRPFKHLVDCYWQKWSSWSYTLTGNPPHNDGYLTCSLSRPWWKSRWESWMSCVCPETKPSTGPGRLRRSSRPWRQTPCTSRRYESNNLKYNSKLWTLTGVEKSTWWFLSVIDSTRYIILQDGVIMQK